VLDERGEVAVTEEDGVVGALVLLVWVPVLGTPEVERVLGPSGSGSGSGSGTREPSGSGPWGSTGSGSG